MLIKIAGPNATNRDYVLGAAREDIVAGKNIMILVMGAISRLVVLVVIDVCWNQDSIAFTRTCPKTSQKNFPEKSTYFTFFLSIGHQSKKC